MDDQAADATKELGKESEAEEKKLEDMVKALEHEEKSKEGWNIHSKGCTGMMCCKLAEKIVRCAYVRYDPSNQL